MKFVRAGFITFGASSYDFDVEFDSPSQRLSGLLRRAPRRRPRHHPPSRRRGHRSRLSDPDRLHRRARWRADLPLPSPTDRCGPPSRRRHRPGRGTRHPQRRGRYERLRRRPGLISRKDAEASAFSQARGPLGGVAPEVIRGETWQVIRSGSCPSPCRAATGSSRPIRSSRRYSPARSRAACGCPGSDPSRSASSDRQSRSAS